MCYWKEASFPASGNRPHRTMESTLRTAYQRMAGNCGRTGCPMFTGYLCLQSSAIHLPGTDRKAFLLSGHTNGASPYASFTMREKRCHHSVASVFPDYYRSQYGRKSTYLRTIGVNYLLACIGAPVCCERLKLYPNQLITSLRTSDSLSDNESYFFAELKRLKRIIDLLNQGQQLFIILDEILKGTNSMDKQKDLLI